MRKRLRFCGLFDFNYLFILTREIKEQFLLFSVLKKCEGVAKTFDYNEKELESEEGLQAMYDRWREYHKCKVSSYSFIDWRLGLSGLQLADFFLSLVQI
ncbi:hypothetical protein QVD17_02503 [Tagetes erecta]|uniref:Uncharacterized protein n=1 Tax=Tagetes erecta TaxID=13708 RepID=A0AAD8LCU7_TARER|nr:hypothetical protein QVD17_02503 [Tagetes erecta]